MYVALFFGIVTVATAFMGWQMVMSGAVAPGEPMYLDVLAPTKNEALVEAIIGAITIAISFIVRVFVKRRLMQT